MSFALKQERLYDLRRDLSMTGDIGDDDPVPLAKAAQLPFHGCLTKSLLRAEAAKGNLEIIQTADKAFVTRNGIKRMIEKCRKKAKTGEALA